jgi:hypothetical protein
LLARFAIPARKDNAEAMSIPSAKGSNSREIQLAAANRTRMLNLI